MKRKMIYIIIGVIVIIFAYYTYLGGFYNIHIRDEKAGGETIVYKEVTGDYNKITPVTDEVYYYLLNEKNIETYKGFGYFYNNPRSVEKEKLRADAGCIIEPKDVERITGLDAKYKVRILPVCNVVTAELPFRGSMTILMGYLRVFPAIDRYRKKHALGDGPVMTIVDVPGKKVIYRKILVE